MTAWSRVTGIEASHFDADTAYASVDRHQLQDFSPYIYRSRDQGRSWQRITTGLPDGVYVHVIKEDTLRRGLLFAGTERGAFVSFDDGDHWQPLQRNLPATSVRDFVVYGNDLIVATHGRGFWVIDDITALRQVTGEVLQADAWLFKPADAINVVPGDDNGTPYQRDEPQAQNPPDGAYIDYYLKAAAPVTLEILDATGRVVRKWPPEPAAGTPSRNGLPRVSPLWQAVPDAFSATAGMHRVVWRPVEPPAPAAPGAAATGGGGRRGGGARLTGTFTARLTVNGRAYTRDFAVRPDPRSVAR